MITTVPNKLKFDWLSNNPLKWTGKKIRNRKTNVVYTVQDVMNSGGVKLQKGFAVLPSNVKVIRDEFVADCP